MFRRIGIFLVLGIFAVGLLGVHLEGNENPKVELKVAYEYDYRRYNDRITLELFPKQAPISVKNFLDYVDAGFYNGTVFHRVIPGFMVQGGGFDTEMVQKKGKAPIQNEAHNGLKNKKGTIAMARTRDLHSATSQFFINTVNNDYLDYKSPDAYGYAVFGRVVSGMSAVHRIEKVRTTTKGPYADVPRKAVRIVSATRL